MALNKSDRDLIEVIGAAIIALILAIVTYFSRRKEKKQLPDPHK
jgi:uncharacterized membrane protein